MGIYAILVLAIVVGIIGIWYEEYYADEYTDIPKAIIIISSIILAFALLITGVNKSFMRVEQDYIDFMDVRNKLAIELNTCSEEELPSAIRDANEFNSLVEKRQKQLHNIFVNAFVSPAWERIPLLEVKEIEPVEVTRWKETESLNTD